MRVFLNISTQICYSVKGNIEKFFYYKVCEKILMWLNIKIVFLIKIIVFVFRVVFFYQCLLLFNLVKKWFKDK